MEACSRHQKPHLFFFFKPCDSRPTSDYLSSARSDLQHGPVHDTSHAPLSIVTILTVSHAQADKWNNFENSVRRALVSFSPFDQSQLWDTFFQHCKRHTLLSLNISWPRCKSSSVIHLSDGPWCPIRAAQSLLCVVPWSIRSAIVSMFDFRQMVFDVRSSMLLTSSLTVSVLCSQWPCRITMLCFSTDYSSWQLQAFFTHERRPFSEQDSTTLLFP